MARDFNAINSDKKKIGREMPQKRVIPNAVFAGLMGVDEITKTTSVIQKNTEENGINNISISLIKERSVNNFDKISNVTLKASIRNIGLLEPIIVRTSDNGKYIVISGHRRLSAFKELVNDLRVEKAQLIRDGKDTESISAEIEKFSSIPAIVFTVVEDGSELLGTNPKYITKQMEEEMYQAANMEARPISENAIAKNIKYFYDLINNHEDYKTRLLAERNKTAERKATKLNIPVVISDIVTKELGFNISRTYVLRLIYILENESTYPKYFKKSMELINQNNGITAVYNDFKMAVAVHKEIQKEDDKRIIQEYLDRMEMSDEPMVDIYNEVFNIKPVKKEKVTAEKKVAVSKVEALLLAVKNNEISIDNAIKQLKKM